MPQMIFEENIRNLVAKVKNTHGVDTRAYFFKSTASKILGHHNIIPSSSLYCLCSLCMFQLCYSGNFDFIVPMSLSSQPSADISFALLKSKVFFYEPLHIVETCDRTKILAHNKVKTPLLIAF